MYVHMCLSVCVCLFDCLRLRVFLCIRACVHSQYEFLQFQTQYARFKFLYDVLRSQFGMMVSRVWLGFVLGV